MARMNALIPLMYEPANPIAAMAQGQETRARQGEFRAQEGLRNALTQYGAGAMQGQPEALNALAAYSPEMAFNLQSGIAGERRADEALELDRQNTQSAIEARRMQAAREAREWSAGAAAEEAARAAAETERLGRQLYMAYQQGPEAWDRANDGTDFDAVPFDDAPMALAEIDGLWSVLSEAMKPEQATAEFRTLQAQADAAELVRGSPEYRDYMLNGGVQRTQAVAPSFRAATPEEAQRYGATAGQIDDATNRFYPAETKDTITEGERRAAGFLGRMEAAETEINAAPAAGQTINYLQDWGAWAGIPDSWLFSGDEQTVLQKQMDWVRAKLRHESGAVIGDDEAREEAATYFPRPGDGDARIKAKKRSREQALEQMRMVAGRAATAAPSAPPPPDGSFDLKQLPTEVLAELGRSPPGTMIEGPNGERLVWDGQRLMPAR
jgi:hypothetical protein